QRIRHRRGRDDRRTRHQTTPGSAETPTRRAAHRSAHTGRGMNRMKGIAARLLVRWETLLVVAIIGVGIWSATLSPFFLKSANLLDLVTPYVFIGLLAFGLTFVVIAGEIDISIVSTLAASIVCLAQIFGAGVNIWLAALAALGIAAALGLANGLLVGVLNLPSLAVTLGTLAAYSGLAFIVLSGEGVASFPSDFTT